jgi:hypothetical protein
MAEQPQHKKHYTLTDIEQYLQGKLSPASMHELEKAALQDPFLADAIEGYTTADLRQAKEDLALVHQQLMADEPATVKIIPVSVQSNNWWRIAAVFLVLAGTALIARYLITNTTKRQEIAKAPLYIAPQKDSVYKNEIAATQKTKIIIQKEKIKAIPQYMDTSALARVHVSASANSKAGIPSKVDKMLVVKASSFLGDDKNITNPGVNIAQANAESVATDQGLLAGTVKGLKMEKKMRDPLVTEFYYVNDSTKATLKEVVVVGYDVARKKDLTGSIPAPAIAGKVAVPEEAISPVGGWQAFNEYLIAKLGLAKTPTKTGTYGSIHAKLTFKGAGKVSKATIIHSFNNQLNRKIARAIKKGPLWIKKVQNNETVFTITIQL